MTLVTTATSQRGLGNPLLAGKSYRNSTRKSPRRRTSHLQDDLDIDI
jgi:hypothetical protein